MVRRRQLGFIGNAIGRKRAYVTFLLVASALLPIYGFTKNPYPLLGLGPFVAFFGTGHFSGFGVLTAEIYPKSIRATAQGVNLQYRPNRRRGGAFHRRVAGGHARIRRRVRHHLRGVPAGRRCLDLDSQDARHRADLGRETEKPAGRRNQRCPPPCERYRSEHPDAV